MGAASADISRRKAVGYLRVSGRGQIDGDGFDRQRQAITEWAAQHGVTIIAWYDELGVSGTIADRPALARMLVELESNHVGVELVLVEGMHRLARDLLVQENILSDLWQLGRDVVPVDTGIPAKDDEDPSRTLIRRLMGSIAEYEKQMLVAKLRAARDRKRARHGRCEGQKPFGQHPGETQTLERIKQLRRKKPGQKRLGYRRIAKQLNQEGHPTRSGQPWSPSSIRGIVLRNWPGMA